MNGYGGFLSLKNMVLEFFFSRISFYIKTQVLTCRVFNRKRQNRIFRLKNCSLFNGREKKKQNKDSYDWIHRALVDWVVLLAVSNQILFISNINHWNLITSTMKFLSFMPEHMHDLFQIYRLADVYNKKQRSKKHWFCLSNELFFLLSICLKAQSQVNIAIVAFIQFYWKYEKQ